MWQGISLFLLGAYYTFLDDAPVMAVVALLLYVGCYQVHTTFLFFLFDGSMSMSKGLFPNFIITILSMHLFISVTLSYLPELIRLPVCSYFGILEVSRVIFVL